MVVLRIKSTRDVIYLHRILKILQNEHNGGNLTVETLIFEKTPKFTLRQGNVADAPTKKCIPLSSRLDQRKLVKQVKTISF